MHYILVVAATHSIMSSISLDSSWKRSISCPATAYTARFERTGFRKVDVIYIVRYMNHGNEVSNHATHEYSDTGERKSSGLLSLSKKQFVVEVIRVSRSDGTYTYNSVMCVMMHV